MRPTRPPVRRSLVVLSSLVASLVALSLALTEPAAAQSAAVAAQSVNRELIDNLNAQLLAAAIPLALFVEVILVYTVWRFRDNDDPEPTAEDRPLEITWTVATAVILVFVGFAAFTVFQSPYISPVAGQGQNGAQNGSSPYLQGAIEPTNESAVEVDVLAYRWGWQFSYEGTNVTTQKELVLPTDREVYLHLTSRQVIHSFYSPALGLKQDAFPSEYNTIRTRLTETGRYDFHCAEFCGSGHSRMNGDVVVKSPEEYQQWLDEQAAKQSGNETVANGTVANVTATDETTADATTTAPTASVGSALS